MSDFKLDSRQFPDGRRLHRWALLRRKIRRYRRYLIAGMFVFGAFFFLRGGDEIVIVRADAQNAAEQPLPNDLSGFGGGVDEEVPVDDGTLRYMISDGDIPADVFAREAGYSANDVAALLGASEDVYDFTSLRIGKEIVLAFDEEGDQRATSMRYEPNGSRAIMAVRDGDDFTVTEETIEYDVEQVVAEVEISSSLYQDALESGLSEATIIGVGTVFSYSIDFASEIQKGDTLKLLYEKRTRDGQPAKDGKVLAAVFEASGEKNYAYYFATGSDADGDAEFGYYDQEARVLERQFLKAPMDFFRITSGYTGRRLHPILGKYTAHYQIDYAAPTGTPTYSTGRGTVISAQFETGWGNIVRIRHSGGYTTHYAHLSSFAKGMVPGATVAQGETIGFVGSTGWSTGPHLDYGMRLNGNPVNPLKLDLPKGAPIAADQLNAFEEARDGYDALLNI